MKFFAATYQHPHANDAGLPIPPDYFYGSNGSGWVTGVQYTRTSAGTWHVVPLSMSSAEFGSEGWYKLAATSMPLDTRILLGEVPTFEALIGGKDAIANPHELVRDAVLVYAASLSPEGRALHFTALRSLSILFAE